MIKYYSGVFYVFFEDGTEYLIPWNSDIGVYSLENFGVDGEIVEAIKGNIATNTDSNGVIEYSPVGPKFVSTYMDPKVIYLGLKITFPDAKQILYRGSLDDLPSWNDFVAELSAGLDEHGEAVVS
jgi:hypothetical protein